MVCEWPWQAAPRTAALSVGGDLESAVRFGLVESEDDLREVTAMICAGLPDDAPCRAVWTVDGASLKFEVKNEVATITQRFVQCDDGFLVNQDFLAVHPHYYAKGHARRLIRNLLILYDTLHVVEAHTHANHISGGYVWARFGARPKDPDSVRGQLGHALGTAIRSGQIPEAYRSIASDVINHTPDDELMQDVARLETEEGVNVGLHLLLPLSWDAYWDGRCPKFRNYISKALQ